MSHKAVRTKNKSTKGGLGWFSSKKTGSSPAPPMQTPSRSRSTLKEEAAEYNREQRMRQLRDQRLRAQRDAEKQRDEENKPPPTKWQKLYNLGKRAVQGVGSYLGRTAKVVASPVTNQVSKAYRAAQYKAFLLMCQSYASVHKHLLDLHTQLDDIRKEMGISSEEPVLSPEDELYPLSLWIGKLHSVILRVDTLIRMEQKSQMERKEVANETPADCMDRATVLRPLLGLKEAIEPVYEEIVNRRGTNFYALILPVIRNELERSTTVPMQRRPQAPSARTRTSMSQMDMEAQQRYPAAPVVARPPVRRTAPPPPPAPRPTASYDMDNEFPEEENGQGYDQDSLPGLLPSAPEPEDNDFAVEGNGFTL